MIECMVVGAGGFVGAVSRYLIGLIPVKEEFIFPVKTFAINVIGCLIIGIIAALAVKYADLDPRLVLFIKAGVCGGFTTFSSYALETGDLMKTGHTGLAFTYVVLSVLCGIAAVFIGQRIAA